MRETKIRNIKTGAIMLVKKSLAGEYIGTGDFELYQEGNLVKKEEKISNDKEIKIEKNKK